MFGRFLASVELKSLEKKHLAKQFLLPFLKWMKDI